ncbi:HAMP domain-containing histidine kinase [Candidatus Saccharibacteria bacterium]|nr:HAMP domain-containing histidine kinase [Candidatus Saccharibacteria bacterium]
MEVKKMPKQATHFWTIFVNRTLALVLVSQIVIAIGVGVALVSLEIITIDSKMLWYVVGGLFLVNSIASSLIFVYVIRPTRDLLAAIIHVSGEQPALKLPDLNAKKYERTGFSDALQTIYGLASKKDAASDIATTNSPVVAASAITDALDNAICGFVTLDHKRAITYANKPAPVRIDTSGMQTLELLFNDSDSLNSWLNACEEHSVHAEHTWTRIPNRLPDQEDRRFFDVIASYQKGATAETVLTLIDRTSLYIVDEENLDFIAFAAHELRGPITVIRGYLDVLGDELEPVFQDDQQELFRRLVVSSNRLSGYINNILNTSRYDRRHLKVHLVEDSVAGVYDMISDDMKLRASSQNRLLSVELPTNLPTIAVDRTSMSEVFGNLIDNAIKYSNEGGVINVTAAVNGDSVDIMVVDHGIGMPESVVSNLFQKFYRSHRSRETVAGTGIGLYISKAIVESHGGTISVRSQDGLGSTFIVSLPIYATVADKLKAGDGNNEGIMNEGKGWIKNHSMYRG